MNKTQQKQYDKTNKILEKFGAKIKDGEEYVHSDDQIVVTNKHNIDKKIIANTIKYLKPDNDFWSFDGVMNDRHRNELQIIKKIAESRGGKLLSTRYINSEEKLEFEDKEGNRFFMSASNIKNNRWSGFESGNVYNNQEYHLNILRKIAESKGGKLISSEYVNSRKKLEFEDKKGNRFFMSPGNVKKNRWSGYESGNVFNNPEYHLNILRKIAESKGGKLISNNYEGLKKKLEFEDRLKNRFWSLPNNVKRGKWSPFEQANTSEEKCRQCFQFIFDKKFINTWDILKRKGKRNLQLDGYNRELKLAFEYQGEQHYNFKAVRGGTLDEKQKRFIKIQENDKIKEELCKEYNITLVKIKYFDNFKNDVEFLTHVINELKKYNNETLNKHLNKNKDNNHFKFDYKIFPTKQKYLDELSEIATKKGGKLISDKYIDSKSKLEFEDKQGNRFWCYMTDIKNGQWSPYESKQAKDPKYHLKIIKELAQQNGFTLISNNYIHSRTKLEFIAPNGDKVFITPSRFKERYKKAS